MKRLLKYFSGYGKQCVLGPLFKLLEACFELLIPLVVAGIVDTGIHAADAEHLVWSVVLMVGLGIIGLICAVTAQYFAAAAAVGFASRLRRGVMEKLLRLSYNQIDKLGTSTMVTRMTSDINQVQNGVNLTLRLLLRSPFVVFGAMFMAFTIDVDAALIFLALIPALCLVVFGIMLITMPMYKRVRKNLDEVTSHTRQNLAGVRVLRAFCKEEEETRHFQNRTQALADQQLRAGGISALMNPVTLVLVNVAIVLLIHVGALRVESGILTQGMVIALYNYMGQILVELVKMASLIITMTKAATCAGRVADVLDMEPDQTNGEHSCEKLGGHVEFQSVTAQYSQAGEPSLENISFRALPGQTIGIIGGTGSGKTTLINLIPRLYDVSSGKVLLDGMDVTELDMDTLRHSIGIVPQKAVLFQGTIRENLLWGNPEATDSQLWEALELAQATEVVKSKEGQLDSQVAQGGRNFSGGQRQRLTIARALVRKPAILILDDSSSALDYATDAALRRSIRSMEDPPTTFIVSQRAAPLRFADRILVLDDGCLVGQGTHEELMDTCPVYQEIYYSQFPKEVDIHG